MIRLKILRAKAIAARVRRGKSIKAFLNIPCTGKAAQRELSSEFVRKRRRDQNLLLHKRLCELYLRGMKEEMLPFLLFPVQAVVQQRVAV